MQALPASMQAQIASQQYKTVVFRNLHLFGSCSDQFMNRMMTQLVEISVMPNETVVKAGEICRELRFVQRGALNVVDNRNTLIEVVGSQGTAPCIVGMVLFIMGCAPIASSGSMCVVCIAAMPGRFARLHALRGVLTRTMQPCAFE